MESKEEDQKLIGRIRRGISRIDVVIFVFLLLSWLLIFIGATLALQRNTERWLPIGLVPQVLADYSVDEIDLRAAPVASEILAEKERDAQIEQTGPIPPLSLDLPEIEVTPSPSLTPTLTPRPSLLTVSAGGPYEGEEGSPIVLTAGGFNATLNILPQTVTYRWDLNNDGNFDDAEGISTPVVFDDEGEFVVGVQARDLLGRVATDLALVTVSNAPPIVNLGQDKVGNEGQAIEFLAEVSDPGDDVLFYNWDFGDGNFMDGTTHPTHIYEDDGNYNVTLRVHDNDGGLTEASIAVTVFNLPPEVDAGADQTVDEGASVTLTGQATDPADDKDDLTYFWDLNYNGSSFSPDYEGSPVTTQFPDGPANIVVALLVKDKDGGEGVDQLNVTVNNVNPTIDNLTHANLVDEGSAVNFTVSASDPGQDTLTYAFDWGNDGTFDVTGSSIQASKVWPNQGTYNVGILVEDDDGGQDFITTTVTAQNVPPTAIAQGPGSAKFEGEPVTFSGGDSFDPGTEDVLTYKWDFGDGHSTTTISSTTSSHVYADNGNYTAQLTVTDDSGAATTSSPVPVTILNANPVAEITQPTDGSEYVIDEGTNIEITFNGSASDPGTADQLTYTWDLDGDGTFETNGAPVGTAKTYPELDAGSSPMEYRVTFRVRDDDYTDTPTGGNQKGEATDSFKIIVRNVPPWNLNIDAGDPANHLETKPITLIGSAEDFSFDPLTYDWDLDNDGIFEVTNQQTTTFQRINAGDYPIKLRVSDDGDEPAIKTATITIKNHPPTAEANGPYSTAVNQPVTLTAQGSSDPTDPLSYTWDFGDEMDQLTTPNITVTHTYQDDKVYTARLTVDDGRGGTATDTADVTVNNLPPTAVASANPIATTEGTQITFDGSASSDPGTLDILTYSWDFGDGSLTTPFSTTTHAYQDNGVYTATLTVQDDAGASSTDTVVLTISNSPPVANAGNDLTVDEGKPFTLTGMATTDPGPLDVLTYAWDFDYNGVNFNTNDTGVTVNHPGYPDGPATYTVALRVEDDDGGTDLDTLQVTVVNVAPIAAFAGLPYNGVEGQPVNLTASVDDVPSDAPFIYQWDLDYPGPPFNVDATGQAVTNIWGTGGNYTVGLRITDKDGATSTVATAPVIVDFIPTANPGGPYNGDEGTAINFDGGGSFDPDGDTLTYAWDFGDGTTGTGPTPPAHTYADDGTYTVSLTVDDGRGGTHTAVTTATITNLPPNANPGGPYSVNEGNPINFNGSDSSDPGRIDALNLTYAWDFGDGTTGTGPTPAHTYADDGTYPVTLTVTDPNGATGTANTTATVANVAPIANAGGPYRGTMGVPLQLSGTGSDIPADPLTYTWDLNNDGTFETPGQTVVNTWPTAGNKTVALRVQDDEGGVGINTATVDIGNPPVALAAVTPITAPEGAPLAFDGSGSTDPDGDPLTYSWNFGDGTTANTITPTHIYPDNGTYTVTLQVDDDRGGIGTGTISVTILNANPTAAAGGDQTVNEGATVNFSGTGTDPGSADVLTYAWDFDYDGVTFNNDATGRSASTIYPNGPANHTVALRVQDDDGGSALDTLQVTVNNAPPVVDAGPDQTVDEGTAVNFSGSATDPGSGDVLTYAWDFDYDGVTFNNNATGSSASTTYPDGPANYTVAFRVQDNDGGSTIDTLQVTVNNVPPTAAAGPDQTVVTGTIVTFDGGVSTDPGNEILTYRWDFNYDGITFTEDDTGQVVTHTWATTGTYTVALQVEDGDGGVNVDTVTIFVNGLLPIAWSGLWLRRKRKRVSSRHNRKKGYWNGTQYLS